MANAVQLKELLEPSVLGLGLTLWALEYSGGGKRPLLRIYIDHEDGVTVDHCAAVSRQVSAVLDVEDPIAGEYQLEVSSPGAERGLYELSHFQQFAGHEVAIRLRVSLDGQRNFKGLLVGVEADEVVLRVADEEFLFPIDSIDRANIVPNWGKPEA